MLWKKRILCLRRNNMSVYFARDSKNGWIKIGCSKNPKKRVKSIPSSLGHIVEDMELLKVIDGSFDEEKFYQNLLFRSHVAISNLFNSYEWFHPSEDVMYFVDMPIERLNKITSEWRSISRKYGWKVGFTFDGENILAKAEK